MFRKKSLWVVFASVFMTVFLMGMHSVHADEVGTKCGDDVKNNQGQTVQCPPTKHGNFGVGIGMNYVYNRSSAGDQEPQDLKAKVDKRMLPSIGLNGYMLHINGPLMQLEGNVNAYIPTEDNRDKGGVEVAGKQFFYDASGEAGIGVATTNRGFGLTLGPLLYGRAVDLPGRPAQYNGGLAIEPGVYWTNGKVTGMLSGVGGGQAGSSDGVFSLGGKVGGRFRLMESNRFRLSAEVAYVTMSNSNPGGFVNKANQQAAKAQDNATDTVNAARNGDITGAANDASNLNNTVQNAGLNPASYVRSTDGIQAKGTIGFRLFPHLMLEGVGSVDTMSTVKMNQDGTIQAKPNMNVYGGGRLSIVFN